MRKLSPERRASILAALVEGNSINATSRMVGASKVTILRLLADVGTLCSEYHDTQVRNLNPARVEMDEIWSFVGAKDRAIKPGSKAYGSAWTWVALDADSKLVISYITGQRSPVVAKYFVHDVASRMDSRVQLSTDGLIAYIAAVAQAFGSDVDYAQIIKIYGSDVAIDARYSPPVCTGTDIRVQSGDPDPKHISTSYVERQNLTVRMCNRRFTRLTNGFSKKIQNHGYAIALHYWYYNFARKHATIRTTPAVASGVADRPMTMMDLVERLEAEESRRGGRITDYLAAGR